MAIDVGIRGAGVVGKTLALLLARQGLRVALQASAVSPAPDIRAFALNRASKALLQDLRAWPVDVCPVQHMRVHGDTDGLVHFDTDSQPTEAALAWIVQAQALDTSLQTALEFAPLVQRVEHQEPCALSVICEGASSATREALGVEFVQSPYAQSAIAARVQVAFSHQNTAWQWMQGGEVCALLPLGVAAPGNSMALVWSVEHAHAHSLQSMDDTQFAQALSAATHQALGAVHIDSVRAQWPLQCAQATRWVGSSATLGAWALAGDAAHTVHPLAGQGLNLGLADVAQLVRVLAEKEYFRGLGDMRLLRRYERARKADAQAVQWATDGLQRLFAHDDDRLRSLRNWGMQAFDRLKPLKSVVVQQAMG